MTQNQKELTRSQSATRQFLFHKTDSKLKIDTMGNKQFVEPGLLAKTLPDILVGKTFIDSAMSTLEPFVQFGAMVIRIDNFSQNTDESDREHLPAIFVKTTEIIDLVCKSENGIWGRIEGDILGCFFPDKNPGDCIHIAEKIKQNLAEHGNATASIGIASYPTINYDKGHIIENARKAIDHAAFFGNDSTVSFDAVSLNISGDRFYQKGDMKGAMEEFKRALLLDPLDVNLHNSLGVCYGEMENYTRALEEFETGIRIDPTEVMAIYNAGIVNMLTGDPDNALKYFLKAHLLGEDVFEVAFQTGRLYLEKKEYKKGIDFLEKAVKLRPESGPAFHFLGECYAAMNKIDEAIYAYKKAIKLNPNEASSLSAIGHLFDLKGENPEIAIMFCKQSIEISPENGLFRNRLGRLYLREKRIDDALKEFREATKLGYDSMDFIEKIEKIKTEELEN